MTRKFIFAEHIFRSDCRETALPCIREKTWASLRMTEGDRAVPLHQKFFFTTECLSTKTGQLQCCLRPPRRLSTVLYGRDRRALCSCGLSKRKCASTITMPTAAAYAVGRSESDIGCLIAFTVRSVCGGIFAGRIACRGIELNGTHGSRSCPSLPQDILA